jgi:hypothetical protein
LTVAVDPDVAQTRRARPGAYGGRRRLSTETRRGWETTEFWAYLAVALGVLIASAVIAGDDGDDDFFHADEAWLLIVVLTIGYMLSRGLAKSGARERYWDDPNERGLVDSVKDKITGD